MSMLRYVVIWGLLVCNSADAVRSRGSQLALVGVPDDRAHFLYDFLTYGREAAKSPQKPTPKGTYFLSRLQRKHGVVSDPAIVQHLIGVGRYDDAIANSQVYLDRYGSNWEVHIARALAFDAVGKPDHVERELDAARGATDDAMAHERIVYSRAVFFSQQHRYAQAVKELDEFFAKNNIRAKHAPLYLLKGTICLQQQPSDSKMALQALDEALALCPTFERPLRLKAIVYEQMGDKQALAQTLRRLIALDKHVQPPLVKRLVSLLFELEQWDDAYGYLKELDEKSSNHYFDLALLSWKMQNGPRALEHLEKAICQDSSSVRAQLLKLEILMADNKRREALNQFRSWLQTDKTKRAFAALATCTDRMFPRKEVIGLLISLRGCKGIEREIVSLLGDLYTLDKQYRHAEKCYNRFVKLSDTSSRAHRVKALYNLGYLSWCQKDLERACGYLDKARALDPENSAILTMLASLYAKRPGKRSARAAQAMLDRVAVSSPKISIKLGQVCKQGGPIDYNPSLFWIAQRPVSAAPVVPLVQVSGPSTTLTMTCGSQTRSPA
jgi:tetratricopeptide (TPR) repeat protein